LPRFDPSPHGPAPARGAIRFIHLQWLSNFNGLSASCGIKSLCLGDLSLLGAHLATSPSGGTAGQRLPAPRQALLQRRNALISLAFPAKITLAATARHRAPTQAGAALSTALSGFAGTPPRTRCVNEIAPRAGAGLFFVLSTGQACGQAHQGDSFGAIPEFIAAPVVAGQRNRCVKAPRTHVFAMSQQLAEPRNRRGEHCIL